MKVPYRLHWQPASPATALFYDGDVAELWVAGLGGTDLPGILPPVRASSLSRNRRPRGDRRRARRRPILARFASPLWQGIFLPVDASLSPALLPDERRRWAARGGLISCPGGGGSAGLGSLGPLGPADLLTLPRLPQRDWQPLPDRPRRPTEYGIVLDIHPEHEPDVFGEAGEQIGGSGESALPPKGSAAGPPLAVLWVVSGRALADWARC